jgi:putative oxidoreductase
MKIAALICRILLGLVFVVFGFNKLYIFIPATMPPGDAGTWSLLMVHHHWMTVVGVLETIGGLLLLSGRFVPLGLTLLTPIIVNVLLFGLFFAREAVGSGIVVALLALFLIYAYRGYFKSLFVARAQVS